MKRTLAIILSVLMAAAAFAGCGQKVVGSGTTETTVVTNDDASKTDETASLEAKSTDALLDINDVPAADLDAADADYQKKAPVAGEEVAVLHTNYGDISFKFFPEVAPKAVYSFKALSQAGRYDNTIFNGTGGESAFGESYGLEISDYLSNIEGSVAMANTGMPNSNGSQFYINYVNDNMLDGGYTIFAQVYDGMDVVNTIAKVQTDDYDKPVEDVVIKSVEIIEYAE